MSAAQFIGRVGGIAAALGVGVALLSGPAVAGADTDGSDTSSPVSASSSRSESAAPTRRGMRTARAEASSAARAEAPTRTRGRVTREVPESVPKAPPVSDFATSAPPEALATPAVSAVPAPAAATLTLPAPSATVAAPSATVADPPADVADPPATVADPPATVADPPATVADPPATVADPPATVAAPSAAAPAPSAAAPVAPVAVPTFSPVPPSPTATTVTPYGVLGDWMINKEGKVADWVGQPYCGKGSTQKNCTAETPGAKTMQEPINTVFQVKARSLYEAQLQLNWSLVVSGFGPSPFSSIGYSGIVGDKQFKQAPKGGPLGLGFLLPLPGELFQNGLIGSLLGLGPAYRDNLFLLTNSHLRTFGGQSDGKGNFIFTASVSEEAFDASTGLPSHSFESYDKARQKLVTNMTKASWISFASNQGLVEMNNAINPDNPTYTTGDHDGKAQVIAIGSLFGSSPVRTWF